MRSERSQSDVIGFVIVFGIVIVGLVSVSAFGLSALETTRDVAAGQSAGIAMESVNTDIESLYTGIAGSRTTELNVESGTLGVGDQTIMTVTVSGGRVAGTETISRTFRPIVFSGGRTSVVAENTLLVRDQGASGATAIEGPLGTFSGERTVLPVVVTEPTTVESQTGGTLQVESIVTDRTGRVFTSGSSSTLDVTFELTGLPDNRATVWRRTMNERLAGVPSSRSPPCTTPASDTVECQFETDALVASIVTIEYDIR